MQMMISIGSDHKGFKLKKKIIESFKEYNWIDVGTDNDDRTDYPIFAKKVCSALLKKDSKETLSSETFNVADCGVLICGSGIGMSIAANRFQGIYAGLCWNETVVKQAKEHDGINVLVLPADFVSDDEAVSILKVWLNSKFKGGRYFERLKMVD